MNSSRFNPSSKLALHTQFAEYVVGEHVYPINVEISPSGVCQATCDFCWYADKSAVDAGTGHRKVFLDTDAAMELLSQCAELGVKSVSWTGEGEPSLHPDFGKLVTLARYEKLEQGIFTNALAKPSYDPSLMEWIRVTVTDKPLRLDHIKELREQCKGAVGIAFNYSGTKDDTYLMWTCNMAEHNGLDYVQARPALKGQGETVDIAPPGLEHPLLYVTDYKFEQASIPHGTEYKDCEGYHLTPFVWEDGNVDTCAYHRGRESQGYNLGNIYKHSFKTILDRAPRSVPVTADCQVCCKLHETNLAIHRARKLEDENFP